MKKLATAMAFILLLSVCAFPLPTWMWTGTYAIDNYGGCPAYANLPYKIYEADYFYSEMENFMWFLHTTGHFVDFQRTLRFTDCDVTPYNFLWDYRELMSTEISHFLVSSDKCESLRSLNIKSVSDEFREDLFSV